MSMTTTIITASTALELANTQIAASKAATQQQLANKYTGVFSKITTAAQAGNFSIQLLLSRNDYIKLKPLLVDIGYTVSEWAASRFVTIEWSENDSSPVISISPNNFTGVQDVHFTTTFYPHGGTAPYTYELVPEDGNIPAGLTLDPNNWTLSGTPTYTGAGYFKLSITDSLDNVYTDTVTWAIIAVFEDGYLAPLSHPANHILVTSSIAVTLSSITSYNIVLVDLPPRVLPDAQTYYSLTTTMPSSPVDGQIAQISILNNPVHLTINSTTIPVVSSLFAQPNTVYRYNYRAATATWYLI